MGPLGRNIGLYTPMFRLTKGTAMIMTREQALLKAHEQFQQLLDVARQAAEQDLRADQVERDPMRRLLGIGLTVLNVFVARHGDGDSGPTLDTPEGRTPLRLPEPRLRRYVSTFGELLIPRAVYGTREGRRIEAVPLDRAPGMPEGEFSYVLEDWAQRFCLKESFAEAGRSLGTLSGLGLDSRTLGHMSQAVAGFATPFRESVGPPPADEEGPLLVVTADGKGVPMRRPGQDEPRPRRRRPPGEEANKKQMACVGAVYTVGRFVRTADDILDEVPRRKCAKGRPGPQHKHVRAEMTRGIGGEGLKAKGLLFCQSHDELAVRQSGTGKPVICLMDGERALWEAQRAYSSDATGVLGLSHVMERLWAAAHCFHKDGGDAAKGFVEERLRGLLEGRVGHVIGGSRPRLTEGSVRGRKREVVEPAVEYLENNRGPMKYDEYLAAGDPIGSGVAGGACRHLVKDRLERTGMRWTVDGAQAMLHVRSLYLNDQWEECVSYRIEAEQDRLDGRDAA
ncbi:MAG: ISKra4 family transposase [Actinobacteria bacterium]|nr:ISKra4 family transposase [Actinomycetota bacterium]